MASARACGTSAPFGSPVVPEVYMIAASSCASAGTGSVAGELATCRTSPRSSTSRHVRTLGVCAASARTCAPRSNPACTATVTAAAGRASANARSSSKRRSRALSGTATAPARHTANSATASAGTFGARTATGSPGWASSRAARRSLAARRSRKLRVSPPWVSATSLGRSRTASDSERSEVRRGRYSQRRSTSAALKPP